MKISIKTLKLLQLFSFNYIFMYKLHLQFIKSQIIIPETIQRCPLKLFNFQYVANFHNFSIFQLNCFNLFINFFWKFSPKFAY